MRNRYIPIVVYKSTNLVMCNSNNRQHDDENREAATRRLVADALLLHQQRVANRRASFPTRSATGGGGSSSSSSVAVEAAAAAAVPPGANQGRLPSHLLVGAGGTQAGGAPQQRQSQHLLGLVSTTGVRKPITLRKALQSLCVDFDMNI